MLKPIGCPHLWLINTQCDIYSWLQVCILLVIHVLTLSLHYSILSVGYLNVMLEQVLCWKAGSVISFKKNTLLHKISHKLFSKNHHIIRFNFKRHSTLTHLSINKEFASFIFELIFFLKKVLSQRLYFTLKCRCKLIKLWLNYHLNDFILVDFIYLLKNEQVLWL